MILVKNIESIPRNFYTCLDLAIAKPIMIIKADLKSIF